MFDFKYVLVIAVQSMLDVCSFDQFHLFDKYCMRRLLLLWNLLLDVGMLATGRLSMWQMNGACRSVVLFGAGMLGSENILEMLSAILFSCCGNVVVPA